MEDVRGQKHRWEAKKGMKELIYQKKYLIKVSQQPQKPLIINFSSRQRNLIKTFQIEAMIALITKIILIFS